MPTATVTSKGQITIPAAVRAAMRLKTGDRVDFVETSPRHYVISARTGSVCDVQGLIPKPKRYISLEEIQRSISRMGSDGI